MEVGQREFSLRGGRIIFRARAEDRHAFGSVGWDLVRNAEWCDAARGWRTWRKRRRKSSAKSRELPLVLDALGSSERDVPDYVEIQLKDMSARFVRAPKLADVPFPVQMEPNLVIEFYSR